MKAVFVGMMIAVLALSACAAEETPSPAGNVDGVPQQPDVPMPLTDDQFDDEWYDDMDFDEDWDAYLGSEDSDVLLRMDGGMFWFEVDGVRNPDITVNQGDRVRIELTSVEGRHDVVIDELDVRSELIDGGESTVVEFVADTVGEFDYYCSYMRHREMGMVGRFIVV